MEHTCFTWLHTPSSFFVLAASTSLLTDSHNWLLPVQCCTTKTYDPESSSSLSSERGLRVPIAERRARSAARIVPAQGLKCVVLSLTWTFESGLTRRCCPSSLRVFPIIIAACFLLSSQVRLNRPIERDTNGSAAHRTAHSLIPAHSARRRHQSKT
jgi:hypothetical protein